ncbi:MAG: amidohydrolase family protein [Acidimicrobiales bacterium]
MVALGGLVMPGLVNAHCHAAMTLFRSAGDGLPLDRWLSEAIWPREAKMTPDDVHAGMVLGSLEMLLAGVTTSMEMYLHDEAIIEAVRRTGGRLVSSPGIIRALHGADLPAGSTRCVNSTLATTVPTSASRLASVRTRSTTSTPICFA